MTLIGFVIAYVENDVICLKQPHWTHDKRANLKKISFLFFNRPRDSLKYARNISAEICEVNWGNIAQCVDIVTCSGDFSLLWFCFIFINYAFLTWGTIACNLEFLRSESNIDVGKSDGWLFTCAIYAKSDDSNTPWYTVHFIGNSVWSLRYGR